MLRGMMTCLLSVGSVAILASAAHAAFVVSDTFTVGDGTGVAGGNLNGTNAEQGGVAWVAEPSIKFNAGDYAERVGSSGNNVMLVPVTPTLGDGSPWSVSARVLVADSAQPSFFTGVGFTADLDLEPFWAPGGGGELWIFLNTLGQWTVLAKDTQITLATNTNPLLTPGFVAGGYNDLKVEYDPVTNRASAYINGVAVVSNYNLNAWNFHPNIQAAGLFLLADQTQVDSVSVVVPEPVGAMFILGFTLLTARRRASLPRVG